MNAYSMNGKNSSFRCSQTLSFTGMNKPINGLFPDRLYRKCPTTPMRLTVKNPIRLLQNDFSTFTDTSPREKILLFKNIYVWRDKKILLKGIDIFIFW